MLFGWDILSRLRMWLATPSFDNLDEQRSARLLNVMVGVIVLVLLLQVPLVISGTYTAFTAVPIIISLILHAVSIKVLLQLHQVRNAARLLVGGWAAAIAAMMLLFDNSMAGMAALSVVIMLMSGMLLGRRAAIYYAVSMGVYVTTLYILDLVGFQVTRLIGFSPFENTVIYAGVMVAGTAFVVILIGDMEDSWRQARAELIQRRDLQDKLLRQTIELNLLHELRTSLSREEELEGVIHRLVDSVQSSFGYSQVGVYLLNEARTILKEIYQVGSTTEYEVIPIGKGISSRVVFSQAPVLVRDVQNDPDFIGSSEVFAELCVPIFLRGAVAGVLNIESNEDNLHYQDLELVLLIANYLSVALERASLVEDLRASEYLYRKLFEQTKDAVIMFDLDNHFIEVNDRAEEMFGVSVGGVYAYTVDDFLNPEEDLGGKGRREKILAGEELPMYEYRFILPTGGSIIGEVNLSLARDTEGNPQHFLAIIRDVSERREMEEEIRKSEFRYRKLFEQTKDGVYLFDMDEKFIAVNERGAEMFDLSVDEFMKHRVSDFMLPEEKAPAGQRRAATIEGANIPVFERDFIRPDGTVFIGEVNLSLVRDPQGNPLHFQSVIRDVSERRRMEQELREERNLLQSLIDAVPSGIYAKDLESRFTVVNRMVVQGFGLVSNEAVLGRTDADFAGEEYYQVTREEEQTVMESGTPLLEKEEENYNDGDFVATLTSKVPLYDARGKVMGIVGTTSNITPRKLAENETKRLNEELESRVEQRTAELRQANRELEAFAYTVSHDLRAPLRAIDGFAAIIQEELKIAERGKQYLDAIRTNITRMNELIDGLLNFSRLSRMAVQRNHFEMKPLVEQAWEELSHLRADRKVKFICAALGHCDGDESLIRQVFVNLLSNALKFTRDIKDATISVGYNELEGQKVYFVRDNGVGFDEQYRDKLFGVFERLHNPSEYEGTGVGLAIVRRILTRHGGEIWAESTPGKGATFYFNVQHQPVAEAAA